MEIVLDFNNIVNKKELHEYLIDKLSLPDYYGKNLDALYDILTEPGQEKTIIIRGADALKEKLGSYGEALFNVMEDATGENELLEIQYEDIVLTADIDELLQMGPDMEEFLKQFLDSKE